MAAYLEKSGYGSQAAAPVTKCIYRHSRVASPSTRRTRRRPDITATTAAPENLMADPTCLTPASVGTGPRE